MATALSKALEAVHCTSVALFCACTDEFYDLMSLLTDVHQVHYHT